jgi:hypothetical protein
MHRLLKKPQNLLEQASITQPMQQKPKSCLEKASETQQTKMEGLIQSCVDSSDKTICALLNPTLRNSRLFSNERIKTEIARRNA